MKRTPPILDAIVDKVLAYRPKGKVKKFLKKAKKFEKKKRKKEKKSQQPN